MLTHGYSKLLKLLAGGEIQFYDFMGLGAGLSLALAVLGELVAPAAMILGFKTRWFAVPALITMLVAAFGAHWAEPLAEKEHALLFAIPFLATMFLGPGGYSVDAWLRRKF
jgi:putative oxidoreductase